MLRQNQGVASGDFRIVQLRNGAYAVHSAKYDEKMHPGLGPAAEAELLYVRQLKICERMRRGTGEFVVWDIGLGAGANALTLLRFTRDLACPLHIVSFDETAEPMEFAIQHANQLGYLGGYESVARKLLDRRCIEFNDGNRRVRWDFRLGDFPDWCARAARDVPAPHAIYFDAFSPAKNPTMWTLPLFTGLFRLLDQARPCNLTNYSRSTIFRVTLLLAGFFVGRGIPTGFKEETTVAANTPWLLDEPLDRTWLERAHRSDSAEPLREPVYRRLRLSLETWEKLRAHPQFNRQDGGL
jgi:tRNA U34 5-methylaminomethyl-2-thiouridine-forming methyltransferase MnmC